MLSIVDTFHQYDTIAYPRHPKVKKDYSERFREQVAEKGYIRGTIGFFKGMLKQSSSKHTENVEEEMFTPLNIEEMCGTCLVMYLEEYHSSLSECIFPEQFSIPAIVRKIQYVYSSLRNPLAGHTVPLDRRQKNMPQVCEQEFYISK